MFFTGLGKKLKDILDTGFVSGLFNVTSKAGSANDLQYEAGVSKDDKGATKASLGPSYNWKALGLSVRGSVNTSKQANLSVSFSNQKLVPGLKLTTSLEAAPNKTLVLTDNVDYVLFPFATLSAYLKNPIQQKFAGEFGLSAAGNYKNLKGGVKAVASVCDKFHFDSVDAKLQYDLDGYGLLASMSSKFDDKKSTHLVGAGFYSDVLPNKLSLATDVSYNYIQPGAAPSVRVGGAYIVNNDPKAFSEVRAKVSTVKPEGQDLDARLQLAYREQLKSNVALTVGADLSTNLLFGGNGGDGHKFGAKVEIL